MNDFEDHIRQDFSDLSRQLVYADYLEEQGETAMADYIRFRSDSVLGKLAEKEEADYQQRRVGLLAKNPHCWQWDNFLALQHIGRYRDDVIKHSFPSRDPASESEICALEELIGTELPVGYRAFLSEISNGSVFEGDAKRPYASSQEVFSVHKVLERVEPGFFEHPSPFTWRDVTRRRWIETDEDAAVEDDRSLDLDLRGCIHVANNVYGTYWLVVRGELRGGTILYVDGAWSWETYDYLCDYSNRKDEFPESHGEGGRLPVDCLTLLRELALERWDDNPG